MSTVMEATVQKPAKPASPLSVRNFRLLWIGESISLLGDHFFFIALPWLVLQLTGSALALGTVMALMGIPRALFMLIGGALVDRFSPRTVMMVSNFARLVLAALLSGLVLTNQIKIEMLYGFALAFGLADAFYFPGQTAIVPQLVEEDQLQAGNTFVQGTAQLAGFLGPVLAGGLIALLGHAAAPDATPGMKGISIAFSLDTVSFVVSLLCLGLMRIPKTSKPANEQQNVIDSIKEGFSYLWGQSVLRAFFLLIVAMNFLILGPIIVGIPVLANTRLAEGAAAYGIIMSAFGGGSLLGIILSNVIPPKPRHMGAMLLLITSNLGIGIALMPFFTTTAIIAVITLVMGMGNGYTTVVLFTWMQKRIPQELMGRVMSLIMFSSVGLSPISNALAGAILQFNLNVLFIGGGVLMAAISLLAISIRAVRQMGSVPLAASPAE